MSLRQRWGGTRRMQLKCDLSKLPARDREPCPWPCRELTFRGGVPKTRPLVLHSHCPRAPLSLCGVTDSRKITRSSPLLLRTPPLVSDELHGHTMCTPPGAWRYSVLHVVYKKHQHTTHHSERHSAHSPTSSSTALSSTQHASSGTHSSSSARCCSLRTHQCSDRLSAQRIFIHVQPDDRCLPTSANQHSVGDADRHVSSAGAAARRRTGTPTWDTRALFRRRRRLDRWPRELAPHPCQRPVASAPPPHAPHSSSSSMASGSSSSPSPSSSSPSSAS